MKTQGTFPSLILWAFFQISFSQDEIPVKTGTPIHNPKTLSFRDPTNSLQYQDSEVVPGLTQRLFVELTGESEVVSFDFQANDVESSLFEVFVRVNNQPEKESYFARFIEAETLTVNIDNQTNKCFIRGDKGFSLTSPIAAGDYHIKISQNRYSETVELTETDTKLEDEKSTRNSNLLLTGITIFGLMISIFTLKLATTRREKKRLRENDPFDLPNLRRKLSKERDFESNNNNVHNCRSPKRREATNRHFEDYQTVKTYSPSSSLHESSDEFSISSSCSVNKLDSTETGQCKNQQNYLPTNPEIPLQINRESFFKQDEPEKPSSIGVTLEFDDDTNHCGSPTQNAIKALVKRLEEQGEIGNDNDDLSAESDDEDQYEAPQLPNYFCCMICFQGERSTMVTPCRHIFGCGSCTNELINSNPVCILCRKEITGYDML